MEENPIGCEELLEMPKHLYSWIIYRLLFSLRSKTMFLCFLHLRLFVSISRLIYLSMCSLPVYYTQVISITFLNFCQKIEHSANIAIFVRDRMGQSTFHCTPEKVAPLYRALLSTSVGEATIVTWNSNLLVVFADAIHSLG